jgi:6-phosphogluconolactonase
MKTSHQFHSFSSNQALEQGLCEQITTKLKAAVAQNGRASLVVSGGRTPIALFQRLSQVALDWKHVWITLADERWVSPLHEASNQALVEAYLLQGFAKEANFIPLWQPGSPEAGQRHLETALQTMPKPFDVVVLGMGLDGHTASWFPCAESIQDLFDCKHQAALVQPTSAPYQRITLTPEVVLTAQQIFVHLKGDDKKKVYQQACQAVPTQMPIRQVLDYASAQVDVYWSS